MSDGFPNALPELPWWVFYAVPIFFIFIILATNLRYNLTPNSYIGHSTTCAGLIIGFIFFYAMQKYDTMDLNVATIVRSLIYLQKVAIKYKQKDLIKYLIQYAQAFLDFDATNFSINTFEEKIIPHITDEEVILSVRNNVNKLQDVFDQRISGTNLIAAAIWYLIFVIALFLTVIFPMDISMNQKSDSILIMLIIWVPVATIYTLYLLELRSLETNMENIIKQLKKILK